MNRVKNLLRQLAALGRNRSTWHETLPLLMLLAAAAAVGRTEIGERLAISFAIAGNTID